MPSVNVLKSSIKQLIDACVTLELRHTINCVFFVFLSIFVLGFGFVFRDPFGQILRVAGTIGAVFGMVAFGIKLIDWPFNTSS